MKGLKIALVTALAFLINSQPCKADELDDQLQRMARQSEREYQAIREMSREIELQKIYIDTVTAYQQKKLSSKQFATIRECLQMTFESKFRVKPTSINICKPYAKWLVKANRLVGDSYEIGD